jgi:probable rRNA maturation factor
MSFSFQNFTKNKIKHRQKLFIQIKEEILGKDFILELILIGDKKSKQLNSKYRNKNYIPNVLSFKIEKTIGQIFINPNQVQKESRKFNFSDENFLYYLVIHGCLHLTGLDHGDKMISAEEKLLKKFKIKSLATN